MYPLHPRYPSPATTGREAQSAGRNNSTGWSRGDSLRGNGAVSLGSSSGTVYGNMVGCQRAIAPLALQALNHKLHRGLGSRDASVGIAAPAAEHDIYSHGSARFVKYLLTSFGPVLLACRAPANSDVFASPPQADVAIARYDWRPGVGGCGNGGPIQMSLRVRRKRTWQSPGMTGGRGLVAGAIGVATPVCACACVQQCCTLRHWDANADCVV